VFGRTRVRRCSIGGVHLRALLLVVLAAMPLNGGERPLRLLFVGNSLTFTNDLPQMVRRVAALDGRSCEVTMLALPNFSLADHLQGGRLERELRKPWDFVILQQGPSSLPDSRRDLLRDTRTIAHLLGRRPATRLALLMVWPARQHARNWDRVSDSYRLAAEAVDGVLIPAGENLRTAMGKDASLPLLDADGFHPAPAGTYLMALTTYRSLTGRLPAAAAEPEGALPLTVTQLRLLSTIVARSGGAAGFSPNGLHSRITPRHTPSS
jgi:hypothetical protein